MNESLQPRAAMVAPAVPLRPKPAVWPVDIVKGAVLGDYADRLGVMGYLTQGLLGFVPIVGTCCAFRDLLADWRKHDRRGMVLNAISLFPVLGGVTKLARAIRAIKNASQVYGAGDNVIREIRAHD